MPKSSDMVIMMIKRFSALLLVLLLTFTLAACVIQIINEPSSQPENTPAAQTTPVQTPEAQRETPSPSPDPTPDLETAPPAANEPELDEDGQYNSKEDVALYIHLYGRLPSNYVTKRQAQDMGWSGGSVERYAGEGAAIGGSRFGNYEGLLPEVKGRTYTECDIDTVGESSRGARRIVFSNDGLIYYTEDHYQSFELLYGEP